MLEVIDLHVEIDGKEILRGINLTVKSGEIVLVVGPNGSGKSTLFQTIAGNPKYVVTRGDIRLDGESILELPPEERFAKGIGVVFQAPVAIPEVRFSVLLQAMVNKKEGRKLTDPAPQIIAEARKAAAELGLSPSVVERPLYVGFSGGEFKRSEVLQLALTKPRYALIDEPDSGLDIDGIAAVGKVIDRLVSGGTGALVSTHYARIINFVKPNRVIVMANGTVIHEGGSDVVRRIEEVGYRQFFREMGIEVEEAKVE